MTLNPNENRVSEEARKKMDQIESDCQKQSRFTKLLSGETKILRFNAEKFEIDDHEFQGKKIKRVYYTVIDVNLVTEGEKWLPMSLTNATQINELLKKGFRLLEIRRNGIDRNTKYSFTPIQ